MSSSELRAKQRVALVSSEPLYREGMSLAFHKAQSLILLEGTTIGDAVQLAKSRLTDLVLLDANNLGDTIETAKVLVDCSPEIPAVALTAWATTDEVRSAFEIGMRGCILKRVQGSELVRILKTILQGSSYVPPELAAGVLRQRMGLNAATQVKTRPFNLTPREAQILSGVARALSNKEIARELDIREKTVKRFMTVILEKLQVRNRVEAVVKIKSIEMQSQLGSPSQQSRCGETIMGLFAPTRNGTRHHRRQ
jgi:two-component system, NarL family, nitrate/nitrite response regulator NarL